MTDRADRLLRLLQHGDSAFPSGSVAFSGGLESLLDDGLLASAAALEPALGELVDGRFLCFDRPLLLAAWQAAPDAGALAALDRLCEASTPAREAREASRKSGNALLSVHRRLDTPGAAAFAASIAEGSALGHLPVVQGLAWRGAGLDAGETVAAAAHTLLAAGLSAALRLGVIGHGAAQALHARLRERVARGLRQPPPGIDAMHTATPLLDLAALRHEQQASRLFAS